MDVYFQYGEQEIEYLKKKDKKLAGIIDQVGLIERAVNPDLFSALVESIIGQQISTKAQKTILLRMQDQLGEITPHTIDSLSLDELQKNGITFKKAEYIKSLAQKIRSNEFDINALHSLSDDDVCAKLSELHGIGVWTAEMLMIFSMQRANIFSYGDLAILRGLRMVYRHRKIDKKTFEKYRKRFAPYASVASLYLWAVAGGAVEGITDTVLKNKKQ